MITPRSAQIIKDAESKTADGNYLRAITLYESALDDSPRSADIHYRLALLYDDKMGDSLNALHHFKRYLTLAPSGPRANEVKNFMKKDELELATSLSGDSVVSRAEAARLRNENLTLRKELEELRAGIHASQKPPETKTAAHEPETWRDTADLCGARRRYARLHFPKILQIFGPLEKNPRCEQERDRRPGEIEARDDA